VSVFLGKAVRAQSRSQRFYQCGYCVCVCVFLVFRGTWRRGRRTSAFLKHGLCGVNYSCWEGGRNWGPCPGVSVLAYTVPKFNHPAPPKKIFSFANPQPIRTPFNIYYNPIRRPFLSHSHQFRPFSPIRRPNIIYLIFCPHLAAPLKNIIFAGWYNFGTVLGLVWQHQFSHTQTRSSPTSLMS